MNAKAGGGWTTGGGDWRQSHFTDWGEEGNWSAARRRNSLHRLSVRPSVVCAVGWWRHGSLLNNYTQIYIYNWLLVCCSNACVYSCLTLRQLHTVNFDLSVRSGSSRTTNPLTFYYFGELAFYDFRKTNWKCAVTALYSPWDIGTIGQQRKLTRENVLYFIVFCFIASFSPIL